MMMNEIINFSFFLENTTRLLKRMIAIMMMKMIAMMIIRMKMIAMMIVRMNRKLEDVVGTHRMLLSWRRGEEVKDACVRTCHHLISCLTAFNVQVCTIAHAHNVTDVNENCDN